jgi:outer membrane protein assembly factor BamE (lipoprotein component of BamABCDE complex)
MGIRAGGLGMALAALLALAACQPIVRNHGYVPTDAALALITVGVDTRDTVAEKVGRPSAAGLLNDVGWYWVQSRFETIGPRAPREVSREVVAVSFDPDGTVANVERFGLEEGRIVPLSRRVTEDNVRGRSFLEQLFGNLGGIRAEQILD